MARNKRGGGRPDGARPVGRPAADSAGKTVKASKAAAPAKTAKTGKAGKEGRSKAPSEPAPSPDIRVQLPFFAARIAVFAVALVVLLLATSLYVVPAVLVALLFAGVTTYPLGRMQRKAAAKAAASKAAGDPSAP